jgi:hypothetical protein
MSEVKQLSFKDSADFKFSAAYMTYTQLFQESNDEDEKARLNTLITELSEGELSYPDFYEAVKKEEDGTDRRQRFHRSRISTQRKYEYRKEEQKSQRSKRYR